MRFILCLFSFFLMTSCVIVKVYPEEQKGEKQSRPVKVTRHMIGSGKVMELKGGPAEILFYGADERPTKVLFTQDSLVSHKFSKDSLSRADVSSNRTPEQNPQESLFTSESFSPEMLYVVDGKIMPEAFNLETISVASITTIQIYKGEKAKALYGNQAANGVVVITLKKDD